MTPKTLTAEPRDRIVRKVGDEHPLSFLMKKEQITKNDQLNETVH